MSLYDYNDPPQTTQEFYAGGYGHFTQVFIPVFIVHSKKLLDSDVDETSTINPKLYCLEVPIFLLKLNQSIPKIFEVFQRLSKLTRSLPKIPAEVDSAIKENGTWVQK